MKPRVFIGSSSEGLEVARSLEEHLDPECEVVLWTNNAFPPSMTYIEALEQSIGDVEFAVLVVTPDDSRESRSRTAKVPRDNVVFEIGLFMGRIGRRRTFVVGDSKGLEMPSDLDGVEIVGYDPRRSDGDITRAVSPAATKLRRAIKKEPRLFRATAEKRSDETLVDDDALYAAIVNWPVFDTSVTVSLPGTAWFWRLFLTAVRWRLEDVPLTVFTLPASGNEKNRRQEKARRQLLRELGAQVHEVAELPVRGFFLEADFSDDGAAIVMSDSPANVAIRYDGRLHSAAGAALRELLPKPDAADTSFVPRLVPHDPADVVGRIAAGVRQYRPPATLEFGSVPTADLLLIDVYPRVFKDRQIGHLVDSYRALGEEPFSPLAIELAGGGSSIVTPPVVEMTPEGPVVIEGTTRASYSYRNGLDEFRCVLVRGVREELPGKPKPVDEITLVRRTLTAEEKMQDWVYRRYRHIERAVHPY